MRTFSVFVTGIAAFVGDYRRVVAVDAPQPVTMKATGENGQSKDVTIPAHFPYLRLPSKHIDDTANQLKIAQTWDVTAAPGAFPPDDDNDPQSLTRSTFIQFLHFHEVKMPDGSTTPPTVDMTPLNADGIPIIDQKLNAPPPDATSALWLPSMESLGTPKKKIDPKHITANPAEVAAYIRFPKGRISTAKATNFKFVAVSPDGQPAGSLNRAVAQLMVCTVDVPNGPFTVTCRHYGEDGKDIDINFKGDVPNPWMLFACTSLEDAFQLTAVKKDFGVDFHFRLVYRLAEGPHDDGGITLPKSISPGQGGKPLGGGGCVPPLFAGGETGGN
jgi:hypothetical protein